MGRSVRTGPGRDGGLVRVRSAGDRPDLVRLEGVHASSTPCGSGPRSRCSSPPTPRGWPSWSRARPGLSERFARARRPVTASDWRQVAPRGLPSPALALARRPPVAVADALGRRGTGTRPGPAPPPRQPRRCHPGRGGGRRRWGAGAGRPRSLASDGRADRRRAAVRPACAATASLPATTRPVVALDPDGATLDATAIPADAVVLVGTERAGLSPALRARADQRVAIPMRSGVSSLNLATAVAVALYHRHGG
jgi:RNA methyltransferase, TrmH family